MLSIVLMFVAGYIVAWCHAFLWYHTPYQGKHRKPDMEPLETLTILDERAYPPGFVEQVEQVFNEYEGNRG